MIVTHGSDAKFAPLAFSLSIHSEKIVASLNANSVDPTNSIFYSAGCAVATAAVVAGGLSLMLPVWLSSAAAVWPAYKSFMPFRLYFEESYPKARMQANRDLLASVIDEEDVQRFATVAESVVRREFGQRKWAVKAGGLLNPEKPDHLSYLAAVFTFAPECWHLCTRRVYELHASGAYSSTR
ncbi:hypothetical protein [Pseudomonas sp. SDI]|uniref:hypothetical protein n=1 Tax=Pseudomonas sp. SDI TaxID=2170734 RepID=UPI001058354F|nr:hypothetical protein [Pseudomonas sp. SDI]